jgi:hypothetical protein
MHGGAIFLFDTLHDHVDRRLFSSSCPHVQMMFHLHFHCLRDSDVFHFSHGSRALFKGVVCTRIKCRVFHSRPRVCLRPLVVHPSRDLLSRGSKSSPLVTPRCSFFNTVGAVEGQVCERHHTYPTVFGPENGLARCANALLSIRNRCSQLSCEASQFPTVPGNCESLSPNLTLFIHLRFYRSPI